MNIKRHWLLIKYRLLLLIEYIEKLQKIDKAKKMRERNRDGYLM